MQDLLCLLLRVYEFIICIHQVRETDSRKKSEFYILKVSVGMSEKAALLLSLLSQPDIS